MQAELTNIRLYIENIKIPVGSISVSFGIFSPSQAVVVIPFTNKLTKLKPRTRIQIYYYDNFYNEKLPLNDQKYEKAWILLFDGEITTINASFTSNNTSAQLIATGILPTYLQNFYTYFVPFSILGSDTTQARYMSTHQMQPVLDSAASRILAALKGSPRPGSPYNGTYKGMLGGITRMLEDIFLMDEPSSKNKIHPFYAAANERYEFISRIGMALNDTVTTEFFKSNKTFNWLNAAARGTDTNLFRLLQLILSRTHSAFIPIGTPKYDTKTVKGIGRILDFIIFPQNPLLQPPACNVLFPEDYNQINYEHSSSSEITRLVMSRPNVFMHSTDQLLFGTNYKFVPEHVKSIDGHSTKWMMKHHGGLMEHEKYSGPVPKFIHMQDEFYYDWLTNMGGSVIKNIHHKTEYYKDIFAKDQSKENSYVKTWYTDSFKWKDVDYLQAYANYQFFIDKLSYRRGSVSGKFLPQVVPGMPMLIILDNTRYPVSYLWGYPAHVTHSINTHGAHTNISLQFVRYADDINEITGYPDTNIMEPPWLAPAYIGDKLSDTYEQIIGCPSLSGQLPGVSSKMSNDETAKILFNMWNNTDWPLNVSFTHSRQNLFTLNDTYPNMLGLDFEPTKPITNKSLKNTIDDRRKAVAEYRDELEQYTWEKIDYTKPVEGIDDET